MTSVKLLGRRVNLYFKIRKILEDMHHGITINRELKKFHKNFHFSMLCFRRFCFRGECFLQFHLLVPKSMYDIQGVRTTYDGFNSLFLTVHIGTTFLQFKSLTDSFVQVIV